MNLHFAESSSVVHIRQGLKDVVGLLMRGQTARNVGAKHSGDQFCWLTQIFVPECFALSHSQGEAFGNRYFRITRQIVVRMLRPYRIRVFGVRHLLDSPTISLICEWNLQLTEKQEVR
jgi:hypothetical protein